MATVLAAADSWTAILLLFLTAIFLLLWKYGYELLKLARDSNEKAHTAAATVSQVKNTTDQVRRNIITNHGSMNLGDAIDRITAVVWDLQRSVEHMKTARSEDAMTLDRVAKRVEAIGDGLVDYIDEQQDVIAYGRAHMAAHLADTLHDQKKDGAR